MLIRLRRKILHSLDANQKCLKEKRLLIVCLPSALNSFFMNEKNENESEWKGVFKQV